MTEKIITRFAPSPTGYLHIGGARTALFNWLFARHHGGKMLLRIEDTDRQRSTPEAIDAILDGLAWLGLNWDEEVVYQFSRLERHQEAVQHLLDTGRAYRCYATPEDLEQMRFQAQSEGRPPRYDGRWRDRPASEAPEGVAPAIRLRVPETGETVITDQVQGRVIIPNKDLDDLVLLRSDGTPTYMLAVVVDDHDMGITHIIRGVDHLTNAARQIQIYQAFDWKVPVMAHIPLIHGPDGSKLSKRHGALGVEAYRAMGYLPAAMRNYLARLGWSHGDDEVFSTEQAIAWFGLDHVGKSPARFDFAKLENLNGQYIRHLPDEVLLEEFLSALPHLEGGAAFLDNINRSQLAQALPSLKERAKTLNELLAGAQFLVASRPLAVDEKAGAVLTDAAKAMFSRLLPELEALPDWSAASTEQVVRRFSEGENIKLGMVAQPLRAALTGRLTSPPIFDVLAVLGRDESLNRIRDQTS